MRLRAFACPLRVPPPLATPRPPLVALATAALLAFAPGCQKPGADDGSRQTDTIAPTSDSASRASEAPADRFTGHLLHEVVPDSALMASWTVYPTERRIGLRLVDVDGLWMLLADTLVGYDGPKALWRIRAARKIPAPAEGEGYVASCAIGDADAADATVVARVTMSANESLSPIHAAWRLDPVGWRFNDFPADSLSCYNEGGGN